MNFNETYTCHDTPLIVHVTHDGDPRFSTNLSLEIRPTEVFNDILHTYSGDVVTIPGPTIDIATTQAHINEMSDAFSHHPQDLPDTLHRLGYELVARTIDSVPRVDKRPKESREFWDDVRDMQKAESK